MSSYLYPTCPRCGTTVPDGHDDFDGHHKDGEAIDFCCHNCEHEFKMRAVVQYEVVECQCSACRSRSDDKAETK
jgi:hypothetical protein